jgi:precorrin-2 C20-methyltransferase / precorrin-3B C17-methyltransferase
MVITPLADLDPDLVDMSCLLIIGSSQTRVTSTSVWTPRSAKSIVNGG